MTRVGYPSKPITERTLPIVAVPTTAGTGAEVTSVAVITIPATHEKHGIINPRVFPRVAIVDPGLTLSLPARLTAGTGLTSSRTRLRPLRASSRPRSRTWWPWRPCAS